MHKPVPHNTNKSNTMRLSTKSTGARGVCAMPPHGRQFTVQPQLRPIMNVSSSCKPSGCFKSANVGILPNCKINTIK